MRNARLAQLDRASASGAKGQNGPRLAGPTVAKECRDRCLACGARILWGLTERGAARRLNAQPVPMGKFVWEKAVEDGAPVVRLLKSRDRFSVDSLRYEDHADSCRAVRQ